MHTTWTSFSYNRSWTVSSYWKINQLIPLILGVGKSNHFSWSLLVIRITCGPVVCFSWLFSYHFVQLFKYQIGQAGSVQFDFFFLPSTRKEYERNSEGSTVELIVQAFYIPYSITHLSIGSSVIPDPKLVAYHFEYRSSLINYVHFGAGIAMLHESEYRSCVIRTVAED